jgi:ribosomal protein S25
MNDEGRTTTDLRPSSFVIGLSSWEDEMADEVSEELLNKILEFFKKKSKMLTSRDVAAGVGIENALAKKALTVLVNDGRLEFTSYGGATFIKLPDSNP